MHFIGDCHGKFADLKRICDRLAPDRCMQLGAMGFGHDDEFHACQNLSFIRGNHDNPDVCRQYANYLGDHGIQFEEAPNWPFPISPEDDENKD